MKRSSSSQGNADLPKAVTAAKDAPASCPQAPAEAPVEPPAEPGAEPRAAAENTKKVNFGYIFQRLGILIAMYLFGFILIAGRFRHFVLYIFFREYFLFGSCVIMYGIFAHFYGEAMDATKFRYDKVPFLPWKWEQEGRFYQTKLHIRRWKDICFDASRAFPHMVPKSVDTTDPSRLEMMLQETCKAEVVHWSILVFGNLLMAIVVDFGWNIFFCLIYSFYNLMDITIQRYNRPRLYKIFLHALSRREKERVSASEPKEEFS